MSFYAHALMCVFVCVLQKHLNSVDNFGKRSIYPECWWNLITRSAFAYHLLPVAWLNENERKIYQAYTRAGHIQTVSRDKWNLLLGLNTYLSHIRKLVL